MRKIVDKRLVYGICAIVALVGLIVGCLYLISKRQ